MPHHSDVCLNSSERLGKKSRCAAGEGLEDDMWVGFLVDQEGLVQVKTVGTQWNKGWSRNTARRPFALHAVT